jgi:hypothetical protein
LLRVDLLDKAVSASVTSNDRAFFSLTRSPSYSVISGARGTAVSVKASLGDDLADHGDRSLRIFEFILIAP